MNSWQVLKKKGLSEKEAGMAAKTKTKNKKKSKNQKPKQKNKTLFILLQMGGKFH